jgi:hypothetical protein
MSSLMKGTGHLSEANLLISKGRPFESSVGGNEVGTP